MKRPVVIATCFALALTACGDDGGAATTTVTTLPAVTTSTAAVTTLPANDTTTVPTGASTATTDDDGVFRIEIEQSGAISVFVEGEPVDVGDRIAVPVGAMIRIDVRLEAADEVHVHGYDVAVDVVPGDEARLEFIADIPGIFEVELEGAGTLLFELEVS